jgi:hypothetical protein
MKCRVLPLGRSVSRLSMFISWAEEHEMMFEKQSPKIDAVCVGLLALFLVGLAAYSVIIQFLK